MKDIKFEIVEEYGVLSESAKGWKKEFNRVSWNNDSPKYDIRSWAPDREKSGKGITLTEAELRSLIKIAEQVLSVKESPDGPKDETGVLWRDVILAAPESIREHLIPSHLEKLNDDTVVITVKKGNAFSVLTDPENNKKLSDFVEKTMGRQYNVELVESAWI